MQRPMDGQKRRRVERGKSPRTGSTGSRVIMKLLLQIVLNGVQNPPSRGSGAEKKGIGDNYHEDGFEDVQTKEGNSWNFHFHEILNLWSKED